MRVKYDLKRFTSFFKVFFLFDQKHIAIQTHQDIRVGYFKMSNLKKTEIRTKKIEKIVNHYLFIKVIKRSRITICIFANCIETMQL